MCSDQFSFAFHVRVHDHFFMDVLQHDLTSWAFFARAVLAYMQGRGGAAVPRMARNFCALLEEWGGYCHCQRPPTSFHRLLVLATSRNRRAESSAPLPGRPCSLDATIFQTLSKTGLKGRECKPSTINHASDLLDAMAVCDEHRAEVLEFVNNLQRLTACATVILTITRILYGYFFMARVTKS